MRFKVADTWYEAKPGQPIMVELTDQDKRNILSMVFDGTKYAVFDENNELTKEDKFKWMGE
jgi:hypothetical protein